MHALYTTFTTLPSPPSLPILTIQKEVMLPTPSTDHVEFDRIYEPAEDYVLLLDTLSSEAEEEFMKSCFNPKLESKNVGSSPCALVVEIGTGSGVVLSFLHAHAEIIFGRSDVLTWGVDVNRFA